MTSPWDPQTEIPHRGQADTQVTLVEGASFVVSSRSGDIVPGTPQGLFVLDTRILSRFELLVDGEPPETLGAVNADPFSATFVQRVLPPPGRADGSVVLLRRRWVGAGMREDIVVRNYGATPASLTLQLRVDADFADLFEVKEDRVAAGAPRRTATYTRDCLELEGDTGSSRRGVRVSFDRVPVAGVQPCLWNVEVPPGGDWSLCLEVGASVEGRWITPMYRCGEPVERSEAGRRLALWRTSVPTVTTDHAPLSRAVRRASEDLGALRMFDPDHPGRTVVAAGAPWFMALFGRDSLLTAWMALLVDPSLALGVLQTLAELQGEQVDEQTEEQPGRIAHELRVGSQGVLALGGRQVYYGTADATPLFVMLLGEVRRWGVADSEVERLLPHADRALAWIRDYGDRDGDGYVEYQRLREGGLANQGWKDSWDAVRFADGTFAQAPIALCEVQGYVYSAYVARSHFASEAGDEAGAAHYAAAAAELKANFNRDFWLEDRQAFALALDRDKRPVDALASNMGHCLWTGIVDEDKAPAVAQQLLSEAMFSGGGVRTLADSMAAYNPISYHNGSVWPHDNAILAAGLMRYGFVDQAHQVIRGMLAVSATADGRLPELFCGFGVGELPGPVPYPTSCSPQAWAAASPLLMVRSLLRFDPAMGSSRVWLAPALPEEITRLRVDNIPLAGARLTIEVEDGAVAVTGLPADIEVIDEPRAPVTATGV